MAQTPPRATRPAALSAAPITATPPAPPTPPAAPARPLPVLVSRRRHTQPAASTHTSHHGRQGGGLTALAREARHGVQIVLYGNPPTNLNSGGENVLSRFVELFGGTVMSTRWPPGHDLATTVVVYSDSVVGNPLRARHVVRWVLYFPTAAVVASWAPTDLVVDYSATYGQLHRRLMGGDRPAAHGQFQLVFLPPIDWTPAPKTIAAAFLYRKATAGHQGAQIRYNTDVLHPPDAVSLQTCATFTEVVETLRRTKTLYCYDCFTFYAVIAAALGCEVVLAPLENVSAAEFRHNNPCAANGMAYGDTPAERAHAAATVAAVLPAMQQLVRCNPLRATDLLGLIQRRFGPVRPPAAAPTTAQPWPALLRTALRTDVLTFRFRGHVYRTARCSMHTIGQQYVVAYHFGGWFSLCKGDFDGSVFCVVDANGTTIDPQRQDRTVHTSLPIATIGEIISARGRALDPPATTVPQARYVVGLVSNLGHAYWNELTAYRANVPPPDRLVVGPWDWFDLAALPGATRLKVVSGAVHHGLLLVDARTEVPADQPAWVQQRFGPLPTDQPPTLYVELRPTSRYHRCVNQVEVYAATIERLRRDVPDVRVLIGGFVRVIPDNSQDAFIGAYRDETVAEAQKLIGLIGGANVVDLVNQPMGVVLRACAAATLCFMPAGSGSTVPNWILNRPALVHTNGVALAAFAATDRNKIGGFDPAQVTILARDSVSVTRPTDRFSPYRIIMAPDALYTQHVRPHFVQ